MYLIFLSSSLLPTINSFLQIFAQLTETQSQGPDAGQEEEDL